MGRLLDSGCSRTIVTSKLCHVGKKRSVRVTTKSGEANKCHGIGTVKVCTFTGNSADIEARIVRERPLDFNLLLGYNAIKALCGALMTRSGTVKFCGEAPVCAALKIDRPDFSVEFDRRKVWTASWKWSAESEPPKRRMKRSSVHGLTLVG